MIATLVELLPAVGFFAAGIVLLTGGAEALIRAAETIALRSGMTPVVVGLTIVAFSTSAPELVASLVAAGSNSLDLAIGNVIGSNIANIGLVLGIAAVVRPLKVHQKIAHVDTPLALFVTVILAVFLWGKPAAVTQWEAAALFAGIVVYTTWRIRSRDTVLAAIVERDVIEHQMQIGSFLLVLVIILSIGALSGGAYLFVKGAQLMAMHFGVPERVIGLTVVALGTSLPEIATVIAAVRKNMFDLVVGNVVGSNIFNILSVVGVTGLIFPLEDLDTTPVDLIAFVGAAVVLQIVMLRRMSVSRPVGALLVVSYLAYVGYVYY